MWSSSATIWSRRLAIGLVAAGLLAACEFRPLYGERDDGTSTAQDLGNVRILPLRDRTGQQLHNLLRNRLNPYGQPSRPNYVLQVTLQESVRELALLDDETATRADLNLFAEFVLRRPGQEQVLFRGTSRSVNSYNLGTSQFATQVSETDARERALRELAEEIRAQVAIFLSRQRAG